MTIEIAGGKEVNREVDREVIHVIGRDKIVVTIIITIIIMTEGVMSFEI